MVSGRSFGRYDQIGRIDCCWYFKLYLLQYLPFLFHTFLRLVRNVLYRRYLIYRTFWIINFFSFFFFYSVLPSSFCFLLSHRPTDWPLYSYVINVQWVLSCAFVKTCGKDPRMWPIRIPAVWFIVIKYGTVLIGWLRRDKF